MGSRSKEFGLVLLLFLLAGGVTAATQSLVTPLLGLKVPASIVSHEVSTGTSQTIEPGAGELVVRVVSNYSFQGSPATPLNATGIRISVLAQGNGPSSPNVYTTNSSGEVELNLRATNYSVLFYDLPMNTSVPAAVEQDSITDLVLVVSGQTYRSVYLNLPSDDGGMVTPWSKGTMEVYSPPSLSGPTATAFLEIQYQSTTQFAHPSDLPLLITAARPANSTGAAAGFSLHWVGFQTLTPFSLSRVSSVGLSLYSTSASVTIHPSAADVFPPSGGV